MKINILGTEYDYDTMPHDGDSRLRENDGFTDSYEKTIRIATDYYDDQPSSSRNLGAHIKRVKRHEIVHAFFCESGLTEWSHDERLADWIALQFPKMLAVCQEVEAL